MSLPTSREITAAGSTPIPSSAFNAMQDSIVGMKFPSHTRWYGFPFATVSTNIVYSSPGGNVDGSVWDSAGGADYKAPINLGLPPGTRITDFVAYIWGTGGAQTVQLLATASNYSGVLTGNFASISAVNPPNAATLYHAAAFTPYVINVADVIWLHGLTHILNTGLLAVGFTVDRL